LRFEDTLLRLVAAAVSPLWRQCDAEPDPSAGIYRNLCLDITPPSFPRYASDNHADVIRALRPVAHAALGSDQLPDWIDRRRDVPLVYFTLGTNTNTDLSMFRAVIDGLSDLDVELLVTIGFGRDPASIGPLPRSVHVDNYVPQPLVLTQPTYRAAARQLQCEIAAMPAPDEVVPLIEEVVAKGGTPT